MTTTIDTAEVIVASPGRTYVTCKITTSDGVVGWGDATLNGRELAVAAYLRDHVLPLLPGRDPARIEETWQYLYRGAYWRRGPVTMSAIGAVDTALWDIKGKVTGQPVYQLLGGAVRDRVLAYTHAHGWEAPAVVDAVAARVEQGFRAVRVQSGVPGLSRVYGVPATGHDYEPAARTTRPVEETWDTQAYLRHIPGVLGAIQDEHPAVRLLHDVHHRLTPIEAARLGKAVEPIGLFWLEDVTPAENPDALRLVRRHTTTPLAIGETLNSIWDFQTMITEQLIDYIRAAVVHSGGISHLRKIYQLGELYQVQAGPHGPSDVSPVSFAASLHLALATQNFAIHEYMGYPEIVHEAFRHDWRLDDGYLHPGDAPGLGVEFDEEIALRHPYEPAYLPVARKPDGTVTDW